MNAVEVKLPQVDIVHDCFHINQHLNQSIDKVHRQANKELVKQGDERLKSTKFSRLSNEENLNEKFVERFDRLKPADLKIPRAWTIKEFFMFFGATLTQAELHFNKWYSWAVPSCLEPVKEKTGMIKNHLPNILTYFKHSISNAVAEGLNLKMQTVKSNARGYRLLVSFKVKTTAFRRSDLSAILLAVT